MKIAMAADHRGLEVLEHLMQGLKQQGHEVVRAADCPNRSCDYPDMAYSVGLYVVEGKCQRGILICGSGIGMSIAANKIRGIRAALVHDEIGADMSRRHNDSNVLCLSADMLGLRIIDRIVQIWLSASFEGGRHQRRVQKVMAMEMGLNPNDSMTPDFTILPANQTRPPGAAPA